jgi:hypothetical protein
MNSVPCYSCRLQHICILFQTFKCAWCLLFYTTPSRSIPTVQVHVFAFRSDWKLIVTVWPSLVSRVVISNGPDRVHIATNYGLDYPGSNPDKETRFLSSLKPSRPTLGHTQTAIQWVPYFFPGGKAAEAWSWPLTSI